MAAHCHHHRLHPQSRIIRTTTIGVAVAAVVVLLLVLVVLLAWPTG
jgi:hypothetical protein